jgi:hypothetical protein
MKLAKNRGQVFEIGNTYKILVGKLQEVRLLERSRRKLEDNIKSDVAEIVSEL